MKLALREMRRRPSRFVTATGILTLIAVLLMFLGGLLDGLIGSQIGGLRAQDADAIVYSSSSRATLSRSRVDPDLRSTIEDVDGVSATGGLGVIQLGARIPDNGPRDLAGVALFGYEEAPQGVPAPPDDGEAYADDSLAAEGVEEGMELLVGPARTPIVVVGFVSDTSFAGQGALWTNAATWRAAVADNRPGAQLDDDVFQALVVTIDGDIGDTAASIDEATDGATETLAIGDAVDAIPGVREQRSTFNQIIGVTIAVAVIVVALFFALITVERVALYGVLKAIGAKSSTLFLGLMTQALVVAAVASAIAAALTIALHAALSSSPIPFELTAGRVLTSAGLLLAAALGGCAFSLRRVLHVDPATAIGA